MKRLERFIILLGITLFFVSGWTYTYDTDTPLGTDAPSVIDDRIREIKDSLQERLAVEHVFALTGTEVSGANTGKHTAITCTSVTSTGALSGTNLSASGTLASTGNFAVNTNKFTVTAASGNTLVAGTFDSTGVSTLADASLLKTSAAPTTDAMIANKKYVDDNIGSANWSPASYTGGESTTCPNGLIIKRGSWIAGASTSTNITFGTQFPTGIVGVWASLHETVSNPQPAIITAETVNGFTLSQANASDCFWMAMGY